MKAKEEIIIEERDDQKEWVYAKPFYIAEKNIAEKITTLRDSENTKRIKTIKKELEKIEKEIARISSGEITDIALTHAKELRKKVA